MRRRFSSAISFVVGTIALTVNVAGQGQRTPVGTTNPQRIDDLVAANRILANEGIVDGLGHVSVRVEGRPDHFFLARDLAPGLVTAADVLEFDLDTNPVSRQDRQLYKERFIHSEIYKARPNVHSVIHAHTPSVLAFSVSSTPLRAVNFTARFLIGGVPTFEIREVEGARGYVVNDRRIGASLVRTLRQASRTHARTRDGSGRSKCPGDSGAGDLSR